MYLQEEMECKETGLKMVKSATIGYKYDQKVEAVVRL
jgi:hypothetical protein